MTTAARPDLDVDVELVRLDDLAAGCPEPTLDALARHLIDGCGFAGNAKDYYDPRNSTSTSSCAATSGSPSRCRW